jgi:hypothetical protein
MHMVKTAEVTYQGHRSLHLLSSETENVQVSLAVDRRYVFIAAK